MNSSKNSHRPYQRKEGVCGISIGVFRFPKNEAAQIAVSAVESRLAAHPGLADRVVFSVYGDENRMIYEMLLS